MIEKVIVHYANEFADTTFDLTPGRMFFCRNRVDGDNKTEAHAEIITRDNARDLAAHLQRWADTGRWEDGYSSPFGVKEVTSKQVVQLWKSVVSGYLDPFAADRAERDAQPPRLDNGETPAHKVGDVFATSDGAVVSVTGVYHDGVQHVYQFDASGIGAPYVLSCYDLVARGWRKLRKIE